MKLLDVNVLVLAYREDAPDHQRFHRWLHGLVSADSAFGVSELVLSGFLRIVTHPKIFTPPSPLADALKFTKALRAASNCVIVKPGARHWDIFVRLCREIDAKGNLVPDAYLAALAIESGCDWISTDRDFGRFPSLAWQEPDV